MMNTNFHYAILGGGIGGLSLAVAMQRKGFRVTVFESAAAFKPLGAGLSLSGNAIKAYEDIGIAPQIVAIGKKLVSAFGKDSQGKVISKTDSDSLNRRFGVLNNFTLHRADLHDCLAGLLSPGTIQFGKAAIDFAQSANGVMISFGDGTQAEAHYLIAADGIHSVVRQKLLPDSKPRYSGYTCWRGVVQGNPAGMNPDEMSETWGKGRRFGVVPLTNNRIYWFATLNAKQNDAAMRNARVNDLKKFFGDFHFPIPEVLARTTEEQMIWGDIIDIQPIRQFAFGRVVLMGDAAHATTPNLGQGACMAIEDAACLTNSLNRYEPEEAFRKFEIHRIRRTTGIVNQSWTFGKIAQLENPLLMSLRNAMLRRLPQSMVEDQLKGLFTVSFQP